MSEVLIVDDDHNFRETLRELLADAGYQTCVATNAKEAITMLQTASPELTLCDWKMPGGGGEQFLKSLQSEGLLTTMPVIILTARSRVEDRVQCLDSGADDYMVKPFSFLELSARARALLRRSHLPSESVLTVRDLCLDRVERKVARAGRQIELTTKEFALLEYLMRNAGRRLTRAMIIEHVWNLTFDSTTNVVDVYINYLRRKVDDGFSSALIHTVRGVGYQMKAEGALA